MAGAGKNNIVRSAVAWREETKIGKLIPNTLTLVGLCSGATAIPFAIGGNWKAAVIAIICAAVFDMLDGRLARLFHVDGPFGAQLDSLADLVSFGIAPGVLVYMWTLYHAQGAGWAFTLMFCACSAIRLARFNVESADRDPLLPQPAYFTGVPTPVAACLILLPMLLAFQFKGDAFNPPWLSAAMIAVISVLMISRVPTLSFKHMHVPRRLKAPLAVLAGIFLGLAVLWPWATLTTALLVYLVSIPVCMAALGEHEEDLPPEIGQ